MASASLLLQDYDAALADSDEDRQPVASHRRESVKRRRKVVARGPAKEGRDEMETFSHSGITLEQLDAQPGLLISMIPPTPPGVSASFDSYVADLPKLLRQIKYRRRWVAFHGKKRVGVADSQTELYERCIAQGIPRDEFYVGLVTPMELPPK